MKYNKSEIMKKAWKLYRMAQKWTTPETFAWALKKAWAEAKEVVANHSGKHEINFGTMMHPITVIVDMDSLTVSGNTFNCRREIKGYGCKWDANNKVWTGTRDQLYALVSAN